MITPWRPDTESQQLAQLKVRLAVINETIAQLRYSAMRRHVKPRGACGSRSPSRTCSTLPVGEPNTFSSS
jgi:hypothetical protein